VSGDHADHRFATLFDVAQHGEMASDSASEGVEHLQAAAQEMLAAARSFLDAVEDVVADRDKMNAMVGVVVDVMETVGKSLASFGPDGPDSTVDLRDLRDASAAATRRVRRVVVD